MGHHSVLAALIGVLLGALLCVWPVSAQAAQNVGLTVSPLRTELTISPGTTQRNTVSVANSTDQAMTVDLTSELFSVINPEYDYRFDKDSDITSWVQFGATTVELAPGESRSIAYDVAVPIGAEPGGRYISIFASTDSDDEQGAITSRQRIASLLYVTVDGPVTRDGVFLSLSAPWWVSSDSSWSATLQNQGTTHFRSRYTVEVQNIFTNQVIAQIEEDALILPGTVRRVTDTLPAPQYPGVYRVVYTIGLGDRPVRVETRAMVFVPLWVWPIVGLFIILTVTLIVRRRNS